MYRRPLSPVERLAAATHHRAGQPDAQKINQFVLEGDGHLNATDWQAAVAKVARAYPALKSVWRGFGGFARWEGSGPDPAVVVLDNCRWDGCGSNGATFTERTLDLQQGPTSEIILIPGAPARVVFRTHHAVMDGMATRFFITEVFKALRGEEIEGNTSTRREIDLLGQLEAPDAKPQPLCRDCLPLNGPADGQSDKSTWYRRFIPGRFKNASPMVMFELAKLIRSLNHEEGTVSLRMTIDLRRHLENDRTIGNLTNFLVVNIGKDDRELDVRKNLLHQVKTKQDLLPLVSPLMLKIAQWVPMSLLNNRLKHNIENTPPIMRKISTGIFSSLGSVDDSFQCDAFKVKTAFAIPVISAANCFLTIWESPTGLDIALATPDCMGNNGRLESAFSSLVSVLAERGNA